MVHLFQWDTRLGIYIPNLDRRWESYSLKQQSEILCCWDKQRAKIPDRIRDFETIVSRKTEALLLEDNRDKMEALNNEIVQLASIINDLNIWFRMDPILTKDERLTE